MSGANLAIFRKSIEAARDRILQKAAYQMSLVGVKLIQTSINNKKFTGFTGNTQTSYTVSVYYNGKIVYFVNGADVLGRSALVNKIQKGKVKYLRRPFEGKARAVRGKVDTVNEQGSATAQKFAKSFKPSCTKGLSMLMTVGVEYWMYLSGSGLTILTDAYNQTDALLNKMVWQEIKVKS